jgi:hypothetical protein
MRFGMEIMGSKFPLKVRWTMHGKLDMRAHGKGIATCTSRCRATLQPLSAQHHAVPHAISRRRGAHRSS